MGAVDDFKKFLQQGNIISLAVAFVIGVAFAAVVTGFVTDIVNPIVGIPGNADFSDYNVTVGHSVILYGSFIDTIIAFIIIALVIFFVIVRPIAKMDARKAAKKAAEPPTTRECPLCCSTINIKATKCPNCTSDVPPVAPAIANAPAGPAAK